MKNVKVNSSSIDTRGHNERNEIDSRTVGGAVPVIVAVFQLLLLRSAANFRNCVERPKMTSTCLSATPLAILALSPCSENFRSISQRSNWKTATVYDTAGNITGLPKDVGTGSFTCVYVAWNRLAAVKNGSTYLAKYERDGLGRITENTHSDKHYYYSVVWQVLAVYE